MRGVRRDGRLNLADGVCRVVGLGPDTGHALEVRQGEHFAVSALEVLTGSLFGIQHPNSLLRLDEPGHFVDVTEAAGIELAAPARTASSADIDRDGDPDLYVSNFLASNHLFINQGDGSFRTGRRPAV